MMLSDFHCDDSRVNFSREIELNAPNAVKRRPMSGELFATPHPSTIS